MKNLLRNNYKQSIEHELKDFTPAKNAKILILFAIILLSTSWLQGANRTWKTSITSGNWSKGSNWVEGVAPTSTDNVVIGSGKTVSININNAACASLQLSGTINLNGKTLTSGDLQGSGIITNNATGAALLTVGSGNFAGIIQNNGTGAVSLTKNGICTLIITG